jgi:hypothetical protein
MKRALLVAVACAVFGLATAYLSAQIFNSIHVDSEHPHIRWYDSFMILLTPGGIIDHLIFGNTNGFNLPYEDSIEGDGLKDAMLFNAIGWMILASLFQGAFGLIKLCCGWIAVAAKFHAR